MQSRIPYTNKSLKRASSSKKRAASNIKISGNSRNKSTCFGDSKGDHVRHLTKGSYKHGTKKEHSISYMVPGMVSNYTTKASNRPISIKKQTKISGNSKLNKGLKIMKDIQTRNPNKNSIFKTSDFDSQPITNQSFQKGYKKIDSKKIKRVKKSKSKHNNSMADYTSKHRGKVSSRVDSKFQGPMYTTFYQKQNNDQISTTLTKESQNKVSTRRKNSIKDAAQKVSMNAAKMVKYRPSVKSGSMFSN